MPQEPKKRHSRARQGKRRASIRLSVQTFSQCKNCGANFLPHSVCPQCGYYDGQPVLMMKKDKASHENS